MTYTPADIPKLNKALKYAGSKLIQIGSDVLSRSFRLKKTAYPNITIKNFLKGQLGNIIIASYDGRYFLIDWKQWRQIIEVDWTDRKKWIKEVRDCDNMGYAFASNMSTLFLINSTGVAHGKIYNKHTGKEIGGHIWNIIIALNNGIIRAYAFEPMTDEYTLIKKGQDSIMGNWRYKVAGIVLF